MNFLQNKLHNQDLIYLTYNNRMVFYQNQQKNAQKHLASSTKTDQYQK